jgi:thiol-disulfide isomerase/thioredoxin
MRLRTCFLALLALSLLSAALPASAAKDLLPSDAEAAWKEVETASKPPPFPEEWKGQPPTQEQQQLFRTLLAQKSIHAAEKCLEFHTRFPDHAKAAEAKEKQRQFVQQALRFGADDLPPSLAGAMSEEEKVAKSINSLNRRALAKQPEGMPAVLKEFEAGVRDLLKQYPTNSTLWGQLMIVAQNTSDPAQAAKLMEEIVSSPADEEIRDRAKGMLRAQAALNRPLEIAFTATDGSSVDVQKMKGKVVLLDFWASWCGPCIASLPEIIDLYEEYHDRGLEILGINLDKERKAMDGAIQKFNIPWKQYYDGKGWGNQFALQYNVTGIPAMWLVDKKGILRTMNAREDLEEKVKELLAENDKL